MIDHRQPIDNSYNHLVDCSVQILHCVSSRRLTPHLIVIWLLCIIMPTLHNLLTSSVHLCFQLAAAVLIPANHLPPAANPTASHSHFISHMLRSAHLLAGLWILLVYRFPLTDSLFGGLAGCRTSLCVCRCGAAGVHGSCSGSRH